jgi:hypothetical protein
VLQNVFPLFLFIGVVIILHPVNVPTGKKFARSLLPPIASGDIRRKRRKIFKEV